MQSVLLTSTTALDDLQEDKEFDWKTQVERLLRTHINVLRRHVGERLRPEPYGVESRTYVDEMRGGHGRDGMLQQITITAMRGPTTLPDSPPPKHHHKNKRQNGVRVGSRSGNPNRLARAQESPRHCDYICKSRALHKDRMLSDAAMNWEAEKIVTVKARRMTCTNKIHLSFSYAHANLLL
jgi:hypothetical protein